MTRRCDRCGASVVDCVGSRQASLFDPPEADPRATDEARAELRAGRVLCPACQRTPELFTAEDAARYPVTAADRAAGMPMLGHHWAFEDDESLPGEAEAEEAARVDAVADLDDDGPSDLDLASRDEAEGDSDAHGDDEDDDYTYRGERWSREDADRAFGPNRRRACRDGGRC